MVRLKPNIRISLFFEFSFNIDFIWSFVSNKQRHYVASSLFASFQASLKDPCKTRPPRRKAIILKNHRFYIHCIIFYKSISIQCIEMREKAISLEFAKLDPITRNVLYWRTNVDERWPLVYVCYLLGPSLTHVEKVCQ